MVPDFDFNPFSGSPPGKPTGAVLSRGYGLIGDDIFAVDIGNVGVPVHTWVAFASTNLDSIYWAPTPDLLSDVGSLFVRFLSYALYRYDNVGRDTVAELVASPSHGMYFANVIRPNWYGHKIEGPQRVVTKEIEEYHSNRVTV